MPTNRIYLALGTNLGDRPANLRAAIAALPPAVTVTAASPVYVTPPWGYTDQPAFLNMALEAGTGLTPRKLLAYLKKLEAELGRRPSVRWGPRSIDIDILFFNDLVLETSRLTLPHPQLQVRPFVLVPLADLAPGLRHPVLGKTVRELLEAVDTTGVERYEKSG